jgi:hypothetical protein
MVDVETLNVDALICIDVQYFSSKIHSADGVFLCSCSRCRFLNRAWVRLMRVRIPKLDLSSG